MKGGLGVGGNGYLVDNHRCIKGLGIRSWGPLHNIEFCIWRGVMRIIQIRLHSSRGSYVSVLRKTGSYQSKLVSRYRLSVEVMLMLAKVETIGISFLPYANLWYTYTLYHASVSRARHISAQGQSIRLDLLWVRLIKSF